jgi:sec-independent protein translocase protein TatA
MTMTFAWLNGWEIVMILVLALVLFGAKKLPELAMGLGQGIKEFKKASRDVQDELQNAMNSEPAPPPPKKLPEPSNTETATPVPQSPTEHKV